MRKFLFYSTDFTDACSWYRGVGPFSQLWRRNWEMVRCPPQINWSVVSGPEIAVLQRPFAPEHVKMASIIKRHMPVVLDYDDDFTSVPMSNPAHEAFSQPAIQDSLSQLLELADLVVVSTQDLADRLAPKTDRVRVVLNAYNDFLLPKAPPPHPRTQTVLWRGSDTHLQDLMSVADSIVEVANACQDWKFIFVGATPWLFQGRMHAQWAPTRGIFEYNELIRDELRPAVCMVPLEDNPFNRAKSDVSWLEMTMAGGVCLLPEFLGPPAPQAMHYTGPENFAERLTATIELFSEPSLARTTEIRKAAFEEVKKNRFLSKVNLHRAAILTDVAR